MSDDIHLPTGQTARLEAGTVHVVKPKPETLHHYRMTCTHPDTPLPTFASAASHALLIPFLHQLEAIGYVFRTIQRVEGAAPR